MTDLTLLFDSYNRQARLYPALLALLPLLLVFLALFPSLASVGQLLVAIALACGLLFLVADFARARGKRLEPILLQEWGGWPTTIWLRHSDDHLSAEVKRRYHAFFGRHAALRAMPTREEEERDPEGADEQYAASVVWLKEQCRGKAWPLVEKENAIYGFRRNLLGLKPFGIAISIMTLLGPLLIRWVALGFPVLDPLQFSIQSYLGLPAVVLGALGFSLIMLVAWLLTVNRSWVREAGDQYARALLASCDSLATLSGTIK